MFNYFEYIHEIDYCKLYSLITNWKLKENEIVSSNDNLTFQILQLLIKKCNNLYFIKFNTLKFQNNIIYNYFDKFKKYNHGYLLKLKSIELGEINNKLSFIKCLFQCKLIEEIYIEL